jgi:SAM-dependent methyltransferase
LREPADHRARSRFDDELRPQQSDHWRIVDLGCGAGSNLRYLAPVLGAAQQWTCIDNDARLLDALAPCETSHSSVSVTTVHADLRKDLEHLLTAAFSNGDDIARRLVSASALLDLASSAWIDALAAACARTRAAALFALSYDGRIELTPEHPQDSELRTLVNAHQRNDKGFGPALGPDASRYTHRAFEQRAYRVFETQTDWHLKAADGDLQKALLAGWVDAAREQSRIAEQFARWHECRLAQMESGELVVRVGHRDLLALPAGFESSA